MLSLPMRKPERWLFARRTSSLDSRPRLCCASRSSVKPCFILASSLRLRGCSFTMPGISLSFSSPMSLPSGPKSVLFRHALPFDRFPRGHRSPAPQRIPTITVQLFRATTMPTRFQGPKQPSYRSGTKLQGPARSFPPAPSTRVYARSAKWRRSESTSLPASRANIHRNPYTHSRHCHSSRTSNYVTEHNTLPRQHASEISYYSALGDHYRRTPSYPPSRISKHRAGAALVPL